MRLLKKILLYLFLGITVLVIGLLASVFLFKDRIINEFIREANKSLNTPVNIGRIDVSALADFPNLAIVFHDVYIEDSHPGIYPLAKAEMVSFFINPWDAWNGKYTIHGLQVIDSETNLKINKAGVNNYTILKPTEKGKNSTNTITLNLKNIIIQNALVDYHDDQRDQRYQFSSEQLITSLVLENNIYNISSRGDLTSEKIRVGRRSYLEKKTFAVQSELQYNDALKKITFAPSQLQLGESYFEVSGEYFFNDLTFINLNASGKETTIQTLLQLLPENVTAPWKEYESEGSLYFKLTLKGEWSESKKPLFSAEFGCREATLIYPATKTRIEKVNLEGSFAAPVNQFEEGELFLKNISGALEGETFNANLKLQNFNRPYVEFDFDGILDGAFIQKFFSLPSVADMSGKVNASVALSGDVELLKSKATAQQVKTSGQVEMQNINFLYGPRKAAFSELNGTLQFNNNDLALSNVSGKIGKSDFMLNGFFKNIITFLLFEDQPIGIETDLKSDFIDLEQLLFYTFGEQQSENYQFTISPNIHLNFNCDIRALSYRRFQPRSIRGDLLVKNQMAVSRNTSLKSMGGNIQLNGILDAQKPKAIDLVTTFKFDGVQADSLFYVFENFRQEFIQDKHLKGEVFADVAAEMTMDEKLHVIPATLIADISTTIKKGELNNFEPLQALQKYLDDDGLHRLRFADLKNDIHIEGKTIYIPQMEVKSNVTTIQVSGRHTFDQHIDYRVVAPLSTRKKIDSDEAFGAIEETPGGKPKIFLKITGTTQNYTVAYDTDAVKKKIASDLKKEVKELKEAFQTKGKKKKKELELEKDSYFDWDN